jgi:membrane-associated protease RseP (regulator of RpoE activity)
MKSETQPSERDTTGEEVVHETDWMPLLMAGVLVVALALWRGWPLVLMIVGIIVMITIHELGHFLAAKWAGMKATEFFIGFGPKLWSTRRGETEYGIKAVPAGAYVRIIGMNNLDEVPPEDEERSYRQQSFPKRLIVVLAGPASHAVQAFVILLVMFAFVGVPGGDPLPTEDTRGNSSNWTVDEVTPKSAAAAAGLQKGDKIVAFDGDQVKSWNDVRDKINAGKVGDEITLTIERGDELIEATTELIARPPDVEGPAGPFLGVGPSIPEPPNEKLSLLAAIPRSVTETGNVAWESLVAMGRFFSPDGVSDYAGTVSEGSGSSGSSDDTKAPASKVSDDEGSNRMLSIYGVLLLGEEAGEQGLANLLPMFLMINVFVGLLNLVPLLPFDGGHASVAIYERIRSRNGQRYHADVSKLLPVAYAVVMGLVVLGVTSLYLDIVNPV